MVYIHVRFFNSDEHYWLRLMTGKTIDKDWCAWNMNKIVEILSLIVDNNDDNN